eukprot:6491146-Amphidinium_carterae.1
MQCTSIILGDFNFDAEFGDRVLEDGSLAPQRGKQLQAAWSDLWTRFAYTGFSHKYSAGLSRIDHGYSSIPVASAKALGAHMAVIGRSSPPAHSDHWAVALTWHVHGQAEHKVPRWVQKHECFASLLEEIVTERMLTSSSWLAGWHVVCLAAELASWKTKELLGRIPSQCAEANALAAAEALRQWWKGDLKECLAIVERAPHWQIAHLDGVALRERLEGIHRNAWTESINAELDGHEKDDEFTDGQFRRHRKQLLTQLLQDWRRKKVAPLATTLSTPTGELCSSPAEIAAEVSRHWSAVFGHAHLMDQDAARQIFERTPEVSWPTLDFTRTDLVALLGRMKDSGAGPDGLLYSSWKNAGVRAHDFLLRTFDQWLRGETAPPHWFDSLLVTPLKGSPRVPTAGDLRPLSLENCCHKIHCALLLSRWAEGMHVWAHPMQRGFIPGRFLEHNVFDIEAAIIRLSHVDRLAALFFSDFAAAFPSVGHEFLLGALRAARAPPGVVSALRQAYSSGKCEIKIGRQSFPGFQFRRGVRQGSGLSPFLFALALDGWLRLLHDDLAEGEAVVAYADDLAAAVRDFLRRLNPILRRYELLARAAGLELSIKKCALLAPGVDEQDLEPLSQRWAEVAENPTWGSIPFVHAAKFLGFTLQAGSSAEYDRVPQARMQATFPLLKSSGAGVAHNLVLANCTVCSIPRHALMASAPSENLLRVWEKLSQTIAAGPYRWHVGVFERAPELFGWPARLLHPQYLALASQLSAALRAHSDPVRIHRDLMQSFRRSRFIFSGTEGMLKHGMIASMSATLQLADRHGLTRREGSRRVLAVDDARWQKALLDMVVPSPATCQERLARRISRKLDVLAPPGSLWRTPRFMRKVFAALKALSTLTSPAASVCLLRLLLDGLLLTVRVPNGYDKCCPWSSSCSAHPSGAHALFHGCWRRELQKHPYCSWLDHASPTVILELIDSHSVNSQNIHKLALIAGTLVECTLTKYWLRPTGNHSPIVVSGWHWLQRHPCRVQLTSLN